jgi:hypothetical protein
MRHNVPVQRREGAAFNRSFQRLWTSIPKYGLFWRSSKARCCWKTNELKNAVKDERCFVQGLQRLLAHWEWNGSWLFGARLSQRTLWNNLIGDWAFQDMHFSCTRWKPKTTWFAWFTWSPLVIGISYYAFGSIHCNLFSDIVRVNGMIL